jgi:excisionase family DNA binding protein
MPAGRYFTVDDVADGLQLSPWAVRRAINRGDLTALKICSRVRIAEDALDAWLEAAVPVATAERPVAAPARPSGRFAGPSGRFRPGEREAA